MTQPRGRRTPTSLARTLTESVALFAALTVSLGMALGPPGASMVDSLGRGAGPALIATFTWVVAGLVFDRVLPALVGRLRHRG